MNTNLVQSVKVDNQSQFTGITVTIISANNIKFEQPIDEKQLFVRIKIHQKQQYTSKQRIFHDKAQWNQSFFYNTSQILDDDVDLQLYVSQDSNDSKLGNSSRVGKSSYKMQNSSKHPGKLIGVKRNIKVSRQNRRSKNDKEITLMAQDSDRKDTATLRVHIDYFERQDIVGGIKCPNLSLRPGKVMKNKVLLQNKHAQSLNLYSWMDTDTIHECEFFPKKFKD